MHTVRGPHSDGGCSLSQQGLLLDQLEMLSEQLGYFAGLHNNPTQHNHQLGVPNQSVIDVRTSRTREESVQLEPGTNRGSAHGLSDLP